VQALPAVIGGLALIYVAYRTGRAEHRRWLRQERLKAYCTFFEIPAGGLEAMQALLVAFYHGKGNPQAIVRRAEQTNDDLQRPVSSIRLLGPEPVTVAAGAVRLSLGWSALDIIEAVGELDDDGKLPDRAADEESPVDELSRRVQSVSEALNHFDRMAANEIQDRRVVRPANTRVSTALRRGSMVRMGPVLRSSSPRETADASWTHGSR
jgi:hypothetical protein